MTELEHALMKLQQELTEAALAVSKALEFGLDDYWEPRGCTNREQIIKEMNDVEGAKVFVEVIGLKTDPRWRNIDTDDEGQIEAKIEKIQKWKEYSIQKGIITQ